MVTISSHNRTEDTLKMLPTHPSCFLSNAKHEVKSKRKVSGLFSSTSHVHMVHMCKAAPPGSSEQLSDQKLLYQVN